MSSVGHYRKKSTLGLSNTKIIDTLSANIHPEINCGKYDTTKHCAACHHAISNPITGSSNFLLT